MLIPLGVAASFSVLLAWADFVEAERSAELLPRNAAALAQWALREESEGRDATVLLQRIAVLNPTSSAPRVRLGLLAEQGGAAATAETWLLEAARVDQQYEPRWTLANFYFRQDRWPEFWNWMRAALEVSYGDRRAAFDLCWRASGDAAAILEVVPDTAADAYLRYVVDTRRVAAIAGAAERAGDSAALLVAADVLIEARRFAEAAQVWVKAGRTLPVGVTDARFERESAGQGFEWRFARADGVVHQQLTGGRGHRVRLSGRQPEQVVLLSQYVGGLQPAAHYRVVADVEGGLEGIEWRVNGTRATEEWAATSEVMLLELWYVRAPGTVRAEGVFDVREVRLSALH
jgi:tetratricopeptide (TPR) repeat protein